MRLADNMPTGANEIRFLPSSGSWRRELNLAQEGISHYLTPQLVPAALHIVCILRLENSGASLNGLRQDMRTFEARRAGFGARDEVLRLYCCY